MSRCTGENVPLTGYVRVMSAACSRSWRRRRRAAVRPPASADRLRGNGGWSRSVRCRRSTDRPTRRRRGRGAPLRSRPSPGTRRRRAGRAHACDLRVGRDVGGRRQHPQFVRRLDHAAALSAPASHRRRRSRRTGRGAAAAKSLSRRRRFACDRLAVPATRHPGAPVAERVEERRRLLARRSSACQRAAQHRADERVEAAERQHGRDAGALARLVAAEHPPGPVLALRIAVLDEQDLAPVSRCRASARARCPPG